MPQRMWRVLHRALHHQRPTRHATWQTGRCALCATDRRVELQTVWRPEATGMLFGLAALRGDVRRRPHPCAALVDGAGGGYPASAL